MELGEKSLQLYLSRNDNRDLNHDPDQHQNLFYCSWAITPFHKSSS